MDQDNSSLGRGLESLIPANGSGSGGGQKPAEPPASVPDPKPEPEPEPVAEASSAPSRETPREPVKPEKSKPAKSSEAIFHIEVEKVRPNPDQPRRNFDEQGIRELAASIREFGLLQPIVVSKLEREVPSGTEVEYELISGERRLMAVKMLGMELVPAIIRNVGMERERLELAIIENLQREDLNPLEMARAMARLQDEFRLTQREIAARLGKSREVIANTVRLLDLPPYIQEALERGEISESHGRLLLSITEPALQERLFRDLTENRMSTRELRDKVKQSKPERKERAELPPELKMFQERLSSELGAPVKIESGPVGRITISFYSEEELHNLLSKLGGEEPL